MPRADCYPDLAESKGSSVWASGTAFKALSFYDGCESEDIWLFNLSLFLMPPRPIVAGLKEAPPTIGIGLCLLMMLVNEDPVRFIFLPEDD